jgi:hypothetical protein
MLVTSPDELGERRRRPVAGRPRVEHRTGQRIGDQPAPGAVGGQFASQLGRDRAVSGQLTGLVVQAHQRGTWHGDVDPGPPTTDDPAGPRAAAGFSRAGFSTLPAQTRAAGQQVDRGIGAALLERATVPSGGARPREVVDVRERLLSLGGGAVHTEAGHAVLVCGHPYRAEAAAPLVPSLRTGRIDLDHLPARRPAQLRRGLRRGLGQHPGLHDRALLGRQRLGDVGYCTGTPDIDVTAFQSG